MPMKKKWRNSLFAGAAKVNFCVRAATAFKLLLYMYTPREMRKRTYTRRRRRRSFSQACQKNDSDLRQPAAAAAGNKTRSEHENYTLRLTTTVISHRGLTFAPNANHAANSISLSFHIWWIKYVFMYSSRRMMRLRKTELRENKQRSAAIHLTAPA